MAGRNIRNYARGKSVDRIDFDPSFPFSTAGGHGEIYRGSLILEAHPDGSPRRFCWVALKSIRCGTDDDDNRLEKIIDEAAVWKALNHPHVLRFLGLLSDVDVTYLVSPFAPHGNLPRYLVLNPDADRPAFLAQTAAGIAYLHEMGIVHGDVKAANVLVFNGPSAKICDFGLAKLADPSPATTQNQVGSLYWMSPEQIMLGQTRTKASDVYAFGFTIYEILSGSIPFKHLDPVKFIQVVHTEGARPAMQPQSSMTGISYVSLWMLATRCWSRSPEGRPSMRDVAEIIAESFGLPESTGTSNVGAPNARPHSTENDQTRDQQELNRAETQHLSLYKAALGLLLGCLFAWVVRTQNRFQAVPGYASLSAAEATQDAWSGGSTNKGEVDVMADRMLWLEQNVQKNSVAIQGNAGIGYISAVLPAGPDILFGREEYIEDLVDRLCNTRAPGDESRLASAPPRVVILGPGGIGKTSVALAAVSDDRTKAVYGDRVHWVPCEQATSPELLVELVARGVGASKSEKNDRKRDIIDFLQQSSTQPRLLLLDNFETPWDIPTHQSEINDILFDIASASPLTILFTMRSDVNPSTRIRWTKPTLPPLTALSHTAARELYLDTHDDAHSDTNLGPLLYELAYMPLAVKLMANRGRLGEMPSTLLALWRDERVRIKLLHQGDDRITSVMVSIELSINSNAMRQNPDALTLLSVLAELPGGARRDFLQVLAPEIVDVGGALATLRQVALLQANASTQAVQLLSPVRLLVLENHRASPSSRASLRQTYFDFIKRYNTPFDFSLARLGRTYRMLGRHDEAVAAGEWVSIIYEREGGQDLLGQVNNLINLGEAYRMLGCEANAAGKEERALVLFKRYRDVISEYDSHHIGNQSLLGGLANISVFGVEAVKNYLALFAPYYFER